MVEDAKVALEARISALEAQLTKQTGKAELARIQWEQSSKVLEDKLKSMAERLSSKEKQVCEMKKDLDEKSSEVQLLENQVERLMNDLASSRDAVNDWTKKAEQAENAVKLKNDEFSVLSQRHEAELGRQQEKEKASERNVNALRVELQEIEKSKKLLIAKLQEKSNAFTKVAQEVDRLNGKLKAMENDHIEQTRKTEEYKGNLQDNSEKTNGRNSGKEDCG